MVLDPWATPLERGPWPPPVELGRPSWGVELPRGLEDAVPSWLQPVTG